MKTRYQKREFGFMPSYYLEEWQGIFRQQLNPKHKVTFNNGDVNDVNVTLFIYCDAKSFVYYRGLYMGWKIAKGLAG